MTDVTTDPQTDRLDELRAEYAETGMVTSDGAVWLISQVVVLRERLAAAAAVPVAAPPTTEQTALRERVAEALATADGWKWGPGLGLDNAFSSVIERYRGRADAVLAVLPASADRAAALREAADAVAALDRRKAVIYADTIKDAWEEGRDEGAALLRRLAVEAGRAGGPSRETTEPQPETQAALRAAFGQVLRHWGLLDEQIDQKAAEEFAVTDLLALLPKPAAKPEAHTCSNCEGIDPDTCWTNPDRPPEQCPRSEGDGYGLQCQKLAGHNLCTFEEQQPANPPAVSSRPGTEQEA